MSSSTQVASGEPVKKCPKCSEDILQSARVCKHCGADLRNWASRHKVLTVVGVLFVVGLVLAASGSSDSGSGETSDTSAESSEKVTNTEEPKAVQNITYRVGDDAVVGDVRWKVIAAKDRGKILKASESRYSSIAKSKNTEGRFIQVTVEVENLGKEMKSASNLNIIDGTGREFVHSTDTSEWIPEGQEMYILSNLNPNVKAKFTDIYEIPADASGLKLKVGDLEFLGAEEALIDLGM